MPRLVTTQEIYINCHHNQPINQNGAQTATFSGGIAYW